MSGWARLVWSASVLLSTAVPVQAQPGGVLGGGGSPGGLGGFPGGLGTVSVTEHDADKDGKVTREEYIQGVTAERGFTLYDTDKDGVITAKEYAQTGPAFRFLESLLTKLDQNKDGVITGEEAGEGALPVKIITLMDADKDGKVIKAEAEAYVKASNQKGWERMLEQYGGKDGKISREQYAAPGWRTALATYDRNGDGVVDKAESERPRPYFTVQHDADRDGKVTRAEYMKGAAVPVFARYDADKDGTITAKEYADYAGPTGADWGQMSQSDADKDGKVTAKEYAEWVWQRALVTYDRNNDRVVEESEAERPRPYFTVRYDADRDGKVTRPEYMKGAPTESAFARYDADKDGAITAAEFAKSGVTGSAEAMFGSLDRNQDGVITKEEGGGSPLLGKRLEAMDADKDGKVTKAEAEAESKERQRKAWEELLEHDADKDGKVSAREYAARSWAAVRASADANNDGVIDEAEADQAPLVGGFRRGSFRPPE